MSTQAFPGGMDHAHEKKQRNCTICLENQKDYYANIMYRATRRWDNAKRLNLEIAMIKLFDTPKLKPKDRSPKDDGTRTREPGKAL